MKPKITLYEHKDFLGRSRVLTESCPRLLDVGFQDITSSVRCQNGVWVIYADTHYKGSIFVVHADEEYNVSFRKDFDDKASSVRLIEDFDFTEEPECVVWQGPVYSGRSLIFRNDIHNLKHYEFNDEVSTIIVTFGAWVGFTDSNFEGEQSLFLKGIYKPSDKPKDQGGYKDNSLSSFSRIMVKPAGKMRLLSLHYDLEKNKILKNPSSVFSWTQTNNTSVEQSLSKTDEVTVQRVDTYEFRWDKAIKVSASMTANVGIPIVGKTDITISSEISASMGSTAGTKTSKTEKWVAEYPSKIPPYSAVTVTSKLTEGKFNMPFTAILCYGDDTDHKITEKGVFYGCQYFDFHTEFNETKLPKPK